MSPLEYVLEDKRICLLHPSNDPVDMLYIAMCGGLGEYSLAIPYPDLCIITTIRDEEANSPAEDSCLEATNSTPPPAPANDQATRQADLGIGSTDTGGNTPQACEEEPPADTREMPTIKSRLRRIVQQRADAKCGADRHHGNGGSSSTNKTEKRSATETKGYR